MSACCVPGCKNRNSAANTIKFYRIPSGKRPFQANRRRLWLRAIHGAGGSTEEIKSGARICGAHFVSGEASLDHDDPDFVPSVFASNKHKRRVKRLYGRRRRRRNKAAGKTAPPDDESPVDLQAFACLESESELPDATGTTSEPSLPKEVEPLSKADEATLSTNSPSLSAHTNQSCAPSPVVLLKSVVAPAVLKKSVECI
ncbi:THAP domain-containing protein 11-like isoform X2 [Betta splendens]|uniref:THAP domain-containing protein 11-like isoform X2 n=1 Tax=Betta splendens TaxID=158456 RepID=A0A6P7N3Z1_BETSP|nr:THAP domain-containing protein 11-like isoform X2 [Betta splendens]